MTRAKFSANRLFAKASRNSVNEQNSYSHVTERIRESEGGFTLLELSLAMTFLAFIMLFVITMIMQMINIYNKSVSLSQMNQAGRQIMSDLTGSARFTADPKSVSQTNAGRLCVGGASYIWNNAVVPSSGGNRSAVATTNSYSDSAGTALSLIRVNDPSGSYCVTPTQMPALNSNTTSVIVGSNVLVQYMGVDTTTVPKMIKVTVILSTAGSNAPSGDASGGDVSKLKCDNNNFCAFATYNFVIYQRG